MIFIDAEQLQDGLYNIKDGKIYKYKAKGGTVRTYKLENRPQGEWEIVGKNHPYKRCPFCKRVRAFTDTRFCDWCGARMKGADDE